MIGKALSCQLAMVIMMPDFAKKDRTRGRIVEAREVFDGSCSFRGPPGIKMRSVIAAEPGAAPATIQPQSGFVWLPAWIDGQPLQKECRAFSRGMVLQLLQEILVAVERRSSLTRSKVIRDETFLLLHFHRKYHGSARSWHLMRRGFVYARISWARFFFKEASKDGRIFEIPPKQAYRQCPTTTTSLKTVTSELSLPSFMEAWLLN